MRGGGEREVRRALCVLSSSFFFYTLCDLWSPAGSKFNILTMAAFNEGPLVCILSLWVIIVMQNIQVRAEPCPPFITCSRQELLQLRPAASNRPDHDFNCSEIKLKPRNRGQRGGVWGRDNEPMWATLHNYWERPVLVNRSDELTACLRHNHLYWKSSLLRFHGDVAEQRNTRVSQNRYSRKKQRLATNLAEASAFMWTISGIILIMLKDKVCDANIKLLEGSSPMSRGVFHYTSKVGFLSSEFWIQSGCPLFLNTELCITPLIRCTNIIVQHLPCFCSFTVFSYRLTTHPSNCIDLQMDFECNAIPSLEFWLLHYHSHTCGHLAKWINK